MTKEQAIEWYRRIQTGDGLHDERTEYRQKFKVGRIAETLWDDVTFTYGIEYGVLIAIAKIFDLEPDDLSVTPQQEQTK